MDSPCPFCFINDLDNEAFTPGNGAFSLRARGGGLSELTPPADAVSNGSMDLSS